MKRFKMMNKVIMIFAMLFMFAGQANARGVVIKIKPPKVKVIKKKPARPYKNAVWVSGRWQWKSGKYVWAKGYWKKPKRGHVWVKGHWTKKRNGHVWIPGHWKRVK